MKRLLWIPFVLFLIIGCQAALNQENNGINEDVSHQNQQQEQELEKLRDEIQSLSNQLATMQEKEEQTKNDLRVTMNLALNLFSSMPWEQKIMTILSQYHLLQLQ